MRSTTKYSVMALLATWAGGAGCGGLEPVATHEPITDPVQLYSSLTLDHGGVNLSTAAGYDTIQLTATPRDALGDPLPGMPVPTFRSTDTSAVYVTADGQVTARATAIGVRVIAELAEGNLRHADTATVSVSALATPPTLASVSIEPLPPDSAVWSLFTERSQIVIFGFLFAGMYPEPQLAPRAVSAMGSAMSGLAIDYASLDPTIAEVDRWTGAVTPRYPGQVRMVARTTAYGVTKADTTTFTVTLPIGEYVEARPGLNGAPGFDVHEVRIPPHGIVVWANTLEEVVEVAFDDPVNVMTPLPEFCGALELLVMFGLLEFAPGPYCAAGDVQLAANEGPDVLPVQARQFPVPGVYPYRNPVSGASGQVVVTADVEAP